MNALSPLQVNGQVQVGAPSTCNSTTASAIAFDSTKSLLAYCDGTQWGYVGGCSPAYACAYMNTLSWRTPTTPLPMEISPRKVFERMFGQGGSAADRVARLQEDRSILDVLKSEATSLQDRKSTRLNSSHRT